MTGPSDTTEWVQHQVSQLSNECSESESPVSETKTLIILAWSNQVEIVHRLTLTSNLLIQAPARIRWAHEFIPSLPCLDLEQ